MATPRIDLTADVRELAESRGIGSLATIRRNGRPQLSVVNVAWSRQECVARTSTRTSLATITNLRRDPGLADADLTRRLVLCRARWSR